MARGGSGRISEFLKTSLWVVPAAAAVGAVVLAVASLAVDAALDGRPLSYLFPGGLDAARGLLSTIAASIITFLGVVFSITMVVLQLASSRFSPRVLRTFLEDRTTKLTLGVFVAAFFYALLVLRTIPDPGTGSGSDLPGISITTALVLVIASVGMFIRYVDHMARAIRVSHIAKAVGDDGKEAIDRAHPLEDVDGVDEWSPPGSPDTTATGRTAGYFESADLDELAEAAARSDSVVAIRPRVGDFVPSGSPWADVYGPLDPERVIRHLHVAEERTMAQDPAFGLRQLVDIAERSLSPGTIDPTSAVQSLDWIHELLRLLAHRPLSRFRLIRDTEGQVRAVLPSFTWEDYLAMATDEIVQYGRESIQTLRRMRVVLEDLAETAPPDRRQAVRDRLDRLPDPPDPFARDGERSARAGRR